MAAPRGSIRGTSSNENLEFRMLQFFGGKNKENNIICFMFGKAKTSFVLIIILFHFCALNNFYSLVWITLKFPDGNY